MTTKFDFSGKVALVTGASYGIGRETALAFARAGAKVVMADIASNEEALADVKALSADSVFIPCDVSSESAVQALHDSISATFGRLDFAFNNAGVEGVAGPLENSETSNWKRTLAINLDGVFYCMRAQVPIMLKSGGGAIINCASIAGKVGFAQSSAYVASKHGVIGLTKTAALELASKNIRVNAVCPGVIRTPMIERFTGGASEMEQFFIQQKPVGRLGEPKEVADVVLFLCSEGAGFIHGQGITMDGGWTVH
jgi:NAD(P)-dependent dehydrogenase (short-subunit alcohol dehydrogenase family)